MQQLIKDGVKIHSVVTDPPYHLQSIVSRYGKENSAPAKEGVYRRSSKGFMGKEWDGGDIAFQKEVWELCHELLYPGGHLLAFSATRNYHRMACAIEDAGFEIRDQIGWLYGTGFPKSHNISKHIDKLQGVESIDIGQSPNWRDSKRDREKNNKMEVRGNNAGRIIVPNSVEAKRWAGWGTALKPAWEPICFARKPLEESSIARNVLEYGTGAINIDECKVNGGRWPANVIHDGSYEVIAAFPNTKSGTIKPGTVRSVDSRKNTYGSGIGGKAGSEMTSFSYGDEGSASRFFYCAKATEADRAGSKHPTVKPIQLMRYLTRLVTPKKGLILDPFAGSGTTLQAAVQEGFFPIGIELEQEYIYDIENRMKSIEIPATLEDMFE